MIGIYVLASLLPISYTYSFSCFHSKVDGIWALWASWGVCSKSCGDGTKEKTRTCTNPSPAHGGADCDGDPKEVGSCKLTECPGNCYPYSGVSLATRIEMSDIMFTITIYDGNQRSYFRAKFITALRYGTALWNG